MRPEHSLRVRVAIVAHVLRRLLPPLFGVVAYTAFATAIVRWDLRRQGLPVEDFQATAYGLYTQLFFEPTQPFPPTTLSRAVFWLTPVVGLFLVAQGLLKVGAGLFDLAARREMWVTIVSEQMRDHVVVCGLGHVGYRVVEELHALDQGIVAIERRVEDTFVDTVRAMGIPVHVGDARRDELLAACGVARAKAVVCATDDDLANLEIALDAKRMNPEVRVVMRMFDQRTAAKVGSVLDLDASFSTSALSAPLIALQATERGVLSAYRVGDVVRVTAEVKVGRETTVAEAEASAPCRIVGTLREKKLVALRGDERVRDGEVLVVDVDSRDLAAVRERLS